VNGLVNILTLGIYTPMTIKVTCAEGAKTSSIESPAESRTPFTAIPEMLPETIAAAAVASRSSGHAELVQIISR
jgi:hypothetical protein